MTWPRRRRPKRRLTEEGDGEDEVELAESTLSKWLLSAVAMNVDHHGRRIDHRRSGRSGGSLLNFSLKFTLSAMFL